ncbi:hypothetical protein J4418_02400 [Candidatus Woesearchaeota archaeon]|nr:hypothetical protein [Candidatus Woesearchaeota archaeon]
MKRKDFAKIKKVFIVTAIIILLTFLFPLTQPVECSKPYIRYYFNFCCIDKNFNNICDINERLVDVACQNQCKNDICDGPNLLKCFNGTFGCTRFADLGILKGECGVECFNNTECGALNYCENYACRTVKLKCEQNCEIGMEVIEQSFKDRILRFTVQNNDPRKQYIACFTFLQSKIEEQHLLYRLTSKSIKSFKITVPKNDILHFACSYVDKSKNPFGNKQIFLFNPEKLDSILNK